MLTFVVNIRPARTFWNSTHCLLNPFTLDWFRNLWHSPMWNMAVNNISYPIYPLSTRTEKGAIAQMIPFFFCSVYIPAYIHTYSLPYKLKIVNKPLGQMLCYSDKENQQEYCHISHVDDHKAELWSVDHCFFFHFMRRSGDCHRFALYPRSIWHIFRMKRWWTVAIICY